jgi:hypothetical protein
MIGPGGVTVRDWLRCETYHRGPFVLRAQPGNIGTPEVLESSSGGSSCLVTFSGPYLDPAGNFVNCQGAFAQLLGLQGSRWTPLRQGWFPAFSNGPRQLLQYQGAACQRFKVQMWIASSGFTPTTWATELRDLSVDMTTGDAGSSGPAPGAGFLLTSRVGVMPAGSDQVTISAMPERRRLIVELLATTGLSVGCAWQPSDATPAVWVPLRVAEPRLFEVTSPLWIASDPPASPTDVAVIEELG